MHEMSVVSALCDQVREHLPPATRLVEVTVEVGSLEHLDEEVMRLAWETFTADSSLEGGRLRVERVPVRVRCESCGHEHAPEHPACLLCPVCGDARPRVLEGWGVVLRSLEAEPVSEAAAADAEAIPSTTPGET